MFFSRRKAFRAGLFLPALFRRKLLGTEPSHFTGLYLNGRGWKIYEQPARVLFIIAANNTAIEVKDMSEFLLQGKCSQASDLLTKAVADYANNSFTYGDFEQKISELYQDPANLNIPVVQMMGVANMSFNGHPAKDRENLLDLLRQHAAQQR